MTEKFKELESIVDRLRAPDGCPWDREQTAASLLPYFLEEAYEVMEAVDENNWDTLKEELGDVLLHIVFQASIARDEKRFTMSEVLEQITDKLIRRHPHVFKDKGADGAFHARQNWEAVKHAEKKRASRLDGVPPNLPALIRAQRLQEKASYAGFDWDHVEKVWDKVHEEILEVKAAQSEGSKDALEEEIGDVLFSLVNLSRFLGISSEDALRKANQKFLTRFKGVEQELVKQGKNIDDATLEDMDAIWEDQKKKS